MGLTTREIQESALLAREPPHYYEVRDEWGARYVHCGAERDAITICDRNDGYSYEKIYLPHTPQTVDVPHVTVAPDLELPMQQILPEGQQEPLNL